ncbi:MAG: HAD family phosphatase [Verrucomicrobia bacterium]|nr:HAD family phosphatase [Verrucomicrobiota bacterium]
MKSLQPRAIIFDMDGVIVDSEPRHERAFQEIFQAIGYGATHGIHFPDYYGTSDATVWRDFIAKHQHRAHTFEELLEWRQNHFLEILKRDEPIFATLPELIAKLAAKFKLAVASGSLHPVIDAVLAMKNLRQHFPIVVSSSDVARGKPAPDIFLRAAELLGVPPAACVVIEDSAFGVTAAKAAGMTVIAITNSLPSEKLRHADHVVGTYAEIERLLA